MSTAIQYAPRYTFEDYAQWEGDWELWEGIAIAIAMSPRLDLKLCNDCEIGIDVAKIFRT